MKRSLFIVAAFCLLPGLLLLPALFAVDRQPLIGPDLSSMVYEEISFKNGELKLAGMLFVPDGGGPFPVAVVIHGSGTSSRANKWYLSVARHLQEKGIAVLLPDKRGSEKSGGSWIGAGFETLAEDTLAAVKFVRDQRFFTASGIGLVGMSQGGWIAPVAAARDGEIAFVVSMSGASVTVKEQLIHEEVHNISHITWPFVARLMAPLSVKRIQNMEHVRAYADFDPVPYWKKVTDPVFFAFGQGDENVPVDACLRVIKRELDPDLVKVYPDGGHPIRDRETGRVQDEFLDDLVKFIGGSIGG